MAIFLPRDSAKSRYQTKISLGASLRQIVNLGLFISSSLFEWSHLICVTVKLAWSLTHGLGSILQSLELSPNSIPCVGTAHASHSCMRNLTGD